MDHYLVLIVLGLIILLGIFGEIFFKKTGIPDAIWLILFGVILSNGFGLVSSSSFNSIIPIFLAITLIVILFEGGTSLDMKNVIKYSFSGSSVAILHFLIVVLLVTSLTYLLYILGLIETWSIWSGVILGGIVGGTSSIVVMPMVTLAGLDDEKKNILSVESALTDALCVVFVFTIIDYLSKEGSSLLTIIQNISSTLAIGIVVGILLGVFWLLILKKIEVHSQNVVQYFYMMTISLLVFAYVAVENLGGSSVVTIFIFGLIVGNSELLEGFFSKLIPVSFYRLDKNVTLVNSQIAFLIKSFFFVLMGIIVGFSAYPLLIALIISFILIFARYLTINILPSTRKLPKNQMRLLYFFAPRGLAAGMLAIQVSNYSNIIPGANLFIDIVFCIVIISILFATIGLFLYRSPSSETKVISN